MPQDAFTIKYVTEELNGLLQGGKISRITQPEKDELSILIYTKKGTVKLEICARAQNCRISIGKNDKRNPDSAPNFCMLLRKHLQNAAVQCVRQIGFERVVALDFLCMTEFESANRTLYCEIMGKYSNVILTENDKILGALKTAGLEDGVHRLLFAGAQYKLPLPQDKVSPFDKEAVEKVLLNCIGGKAKFISNNLLGICYSTALDMTESMGEVTAENILSYVSGEGNSPCVTFTGGVPDDFKARSSRKDKVLYPTLLEAQSDYYDYVYKKRRFEERKRRCDSALKNAEKKCEKRLAIIAQKFADCADMESLKLKGELITANIYAIERGMTSFKAVNYYLENCPEITIQLDASLTPSQNAQRYYKRYAKLKRTVSVLQKQKEECEKEREYLASVRMAIDGADEADDFAGIETELTQAGLLKGEAPSKKKKAVDEPTYRQFTFCGFKILAGRNNLQNERLCKELKENDLWLHVQKYHSCHVGIVTDGREVPDEVIKTAAEICAYYSEAKGSGKTPVDYTLKKFVKKPNGAKAGFAVYTDYKTAYVTPCAHAELKGNL